MKFNKSSPFFQMCFSVCTVLSTGAAGPKKEQSFAATETTTRDVATWSFSPDQSVEVVTTAEVAPTTITTGPHTVPTRFRLF